MRLESGPETTPARWPDAVAYRESIQNPQDALSDTALRDANVRCDRQGLPLAYSGRFAVVFRLRDAATREWALRCFTTPEDRHGVPRTERYRLIESAVRRLPDLLVPYRFAERGIRVGSRWYPTLAMPWADGTPLGRWIENHRRDPERLRRLAATLGQTLTRLEEAGIAHGDWQHDNLLVSDDGGSVRLVDYDGMYLPELFGYPAPELGHPNYQHPARTAAHYDVGLDRFSCLVLQTGLLALAHDPSLWETYGGDEAVLFTRDDLARPGHSALFAALRPLAERTRDPQLAESLALLEDACRSGPETTLLPAVLAGPPRPLPEEARPASLAEEAGAAQGAWWRGVNPLRQADPIAAPLSPLQDPDYRRHENTVLAVARLLLLVALVGAATGFPVLRLFLFLALAQYFLWPRRSLGATLEKEQQRFRVLIADRRVRIQARMRAASPQAMTAARVSQDEYVAEKLRQTPVNRLLMDPDIHPVTTRTLRETLRIENAEELSRRADLPTLSAQQTAAVQAWCARRADEAADEYRRLSASARGAAADIRRLEMEIAEFEREIARLDDARKALPDSSFPAFLRRLVGLP